MASSDLAILITAKDSASGPIAKVKSEVGGLGSVMSGAAHGFGSLVSGFGAIGLAAQGLGAAFGAIKGVGNTVFGLGALNEMEQTRASFMAFTKDAGVTEKILADVRAEANKTPFAFGEMAKAAASLQPVSKSSGIALMDLMKEAEILGASNPLEGLEGASFSLKEAMTGDFTSIIERFNLSRSSINQWKAEGVPNIEIVRRAMLEMGLDSDLIAAKAETLDGRWSTFQDTLTTLTMKMGQPIFDAMKEGLTGLQGVLDANMGTFESWADNVAAGIATVIDAFVTLGQLLAGEDVFIEGAELLSNLLPPEAVDAVLNMIFNLGEAFRQVFGGDILGAIDTATYILEDFGTFIVAMVEEWASEFAAWVDGADSGMMDGLAEMSANMLDWLQQSGFKIVEVLARWGAAFVDWIGPKIPGMLAALGGLLAAMAGWMLGTGLPMLLGHLAEWGAAFIEWVVPRIPGMLAALAQLIGALAIWFDGTAAPVIRAKLEQWGDAFLEWIPGATGRMLIGLVRLQADLINWIGSAAGAVLSAAASIGQGIIDGIQRAISGGIESVRSAALGVARAALAAAKSALGIDSPSKVFAEQVGKPIVQGIIQPVQQGGRAFGEALTAMTRPPMVPSYAGAGAAPVAATAGSWGGGIHVHLEGANIYGFNDFEDKVISAIETATRRARG